MEESEAAPAPRPSMRHRHGQVAPVLPDEVIVEQILTRVPAADTVRFQAVCRAWRAALTSDHFVHAYQAVRTAAAAAQPPEIVFFTRAAAGSTAFYSSRLKPTTPPRNCSPAPAPAARELVTVGNLRANDLVLSGTKPCRGLTLLFQPRENAYHVCNLSTGEHVSLPPCSPARKEITDGPYVLSSTGLGFDTAAGEHVVVRLFEDLSKRQRCEVFGLRSGGGWRPLAGGRVPVPEHAAKGLNGQPPVFLPAEGCFYWHIYTSFYFHGSEERRFATPEPIMSLSVATGEFGWVRMPEERASHAFRLGELDGELCASVDMRLGVEQYELWVRTAAGGGGTPTPLWSLRCRINLASLAWPMREALGRGFRVLPLGSWGGKILLGTSRHEVYAYDPEINSVDRVFSVQEFMDAPREPELLLNIAMHEETVASVHRRPLAGDVGRLKMKLGRSSVANRGGGTADQHRQESTVAQQQVQQMLGATMALLRYMVNRHN
ncbi:unnamed protein product [Urochloa decumbens]|uniref:F-box domain-containing protein n=1 Tax=Urochloa decumbens TaxID=240449 RepID=A0ABC9A399_9POAL